MKGCNIKKNGGDISAAQIPITILDLGLILTPLDWILVSAAASSSYGTTVITSDHLGNSLKTIFLMGKPFICIHTTRRKCEENSATHVRNWPAPTSAMLTVTIIANFCPQLCVAVMCFAEGTYFFFFFVPAVLLHFRSPHKSFWSKRWDCDSFGLLLSQIPIVL